MPTKYKDVQEFFERLRALEVKMESVMSFQRWQTGLLAALILMAAKELLWK